MTIDALYIVCLYCRRYIVMVLDPPPPRRDNPNTPVQACNNANQTGNLYNSGKYFHTSDPAGGPFRLWTGESFPRWRKNTCVVAIRLKIKKYARLFLLHAICVRVIYYTYFPTCVFNDCVYSAVFYINFTLT